MSPGITTSDGTGRDDRQPATRSSRTVAVQSRRRRHSPRLAGHNDGSDDDDGGDERYDDEDEWEEQEDEEEEEEEEGGRQRPIGLRDGNILLDRDYVEPEYSGAHPASPVGQLMDELRDGPTHGPSTFSGSGAAEWEASAMKHLVQCAHVGVSVQVVPARLLPAFASPLSPPKHQMRRQDCLRYLKEENITLDMGRETTIPSGELSGLLRQVEVTVKRVRGGDSLYSHQVTTT